MQVEHRESRIEDRVRPNAILYPQSSILDSFTVFSLQNSVLGPQSSLLQKEQDRGWRKSTKLQFPEEALCQANRVSGPIKSRRGGVG